MYGAAASCMTKIMPDGSTEGDICSDWQASNVARHGNLTCAKALNSTTAKTSPPMMWLIRFATISGKIREAAVAVSLPASKPSKPMASTASSLNSKKAMATCRLAFGLPPQYLPLQCEGGIDWQSGIGAGPYQLVEHNPGVRTLTKKFANYWNSGNEAWFDEVETLGIGDPTARLSALATNAVDAINSVRPKPPRASKTCAMCRRSSPPATNKHHADAMRCQTF